MTGISLEKMDELFGVTEYVDKKLADTEMARGSVERKEVPTTEEHIERA